MSWFTTTGSREVYRGRVRVRVDDVATPEGDTITREVVEPFDSVVVVPVLEDGDVVFVRQHRQPTGSSLLELPAGTLDVDGEDVVDAAARELAEEVGLVGGEARVLGTFWVSPGWSTERTTVVLVTGARPGPAPDGFEPAGEERHMEVVRLPLGASLAGVRDGAITDATTALGLLLTAAALS